MKAEELMVGDLLQVNKDVCFKKGTIVKVCGIDSDTVLQEYGLKGSATCIDPSDYFRITGGVWVAYLDPIPLTPEILEKNGFSIGKGPAHESDTYPTYYWTGKGKRNYTVVSLALYDKPVNGVKILTKIENDSYHENGINMLHSCDIEYVHQLQHAFKSLGTEKEIVV